MSTRSEAAIRNEIINSGKRRGDNTYYGAGSMLEGFVSDISRQISLLESQQESILRNIHFNTLSSEQLDKYLDDFNIKRRSPKKAYSRYEDRNVFIRAAKGKSVFQVLQENNIALPGLTVSDSTGRKKYFITGYDLNNFYSSSCAVSVQAYEAGSLYNVRKNELTVFEKNYKDLSVYNSMSILNGEDSESYDELKEKIILKMESNSNNFNMIEYEIARIPGRGKSTIIRDYDGPGSLLVCVQPNAGVAYPASTLEDIKNSLRRKMGAGLVLDIRNYAPVGFVIQSTISGTQGISGATLIGQVKDAITEFFNTLSGGDAVSIKNLNAFVRQRVPGLSSLGQGRNVLNKVSYTIYEGTAKFTKIAGPEEVISIGVTQIATLGGPDLGTALNITASN